MSQRIQTVRGMHDILPTEIYKWHWLEAQIRQLMNAYSYQEIRTPVLEKTELFCRSIGEATDIVEKEMFTFTDREKDSLSLRPEFTASCARSGMEHGFTNNQTIRMWYYGPAFRHERPQKGRYRQFHQFGVEAFGFPGADVEAEIILLSARLWRQLGVFEHVRLELNCLGLAEERKQHREELVAYFQAHEEQLDADAKRRLHTNPLRILDTKNPKMQALVDAAPKLYDHLGDASKAHFAKLREFLDAAGIQYQVNPRLVRGLDYYSHTVFEWVTEHLGAQGTVCAGGRYDGLMEQLGGKPTAGIGFAAGVERLLLLAEELGVIPVEECPDIYLVCLGEAAFATALQLAEEIRDALPAIKMQLHCGGGSVKSQFKKADKSGARYSLVLGDSEIATETIVIKPMRETAEQETLARTELFNRLASLLAA